MFCDHRIWFARHFLQIRHEVIVAAIAHGDSNIPFQPSILCPLHRRATKYPTVSFLIHLREPAQFRMKKLLLRLKFG